MSNKAPGKWPHYAEWHRLEALAKLERIRALTKEAQELLRSGAALEAVIVLADVRALAEDARRELERAKNGER